MTSPEELSQDETFDLLSNSRRRHVISCLLNNPEGATLQELARAIAAEENDCAVDDVTKKQQKRVYVSLHQTHVRRLSEADVVDREDNHLRAGPRADELAPYFESPTAKRPWHRYYLVVVLMGAVTLILVALDIAVFAVVDTMAVSLAVFLTVAVLTGAYAWARRSGPT